jgi:hypothetical protein
MTERYFMKEYDEEYYIFDSEKISREKVDSEAEYSYNVFSEAMTGEQILERLNNYSVATNELFDIMYFSTNKLIEIMEITEDFEKFISGLEDMKTKEGEDS